MKQFGIAFCVIGSIAALLFVPVEIFGVGGGWYFVFGDAGMGIKNYQLINTSMLLIELLIINGIGIGLFFFGKNAE